MTAFYSTEFTVITSKMRVNQMPCHYQAILLFHRNMTAPIKAMCFGIYVYTYSIFIILAFVKVQNINVFIHVFVKCVFISFGIEQWNR